MGRDPVDRCAFRVKDRGRMPVRLVVPGRRQALVDGAAHHRVHELDRPAGGKNPGGNERIRCPDRRSAIEPGQCGRMP